MPEGFEGNKIEGNEGEKAEKAGIEPEREEPIMRVAEDEFAERHSR